MFVLVCHRNWWIIPEKLFIIVIDYELNNCEKIWIERKKNR